MSTRRGAGSAAARCGAGGSAPGAHLPVPLPAGPWPATTVRGGVLLFTVRGLAGGGRGEQAGEDQGHQVSACEHRFTPLRSSARAVISTDKIRQMHGYEVGRRRKRTRRRR